jgi:hypothetical protein
MCATAPLPAGDALNPGLHVSVVDAIDSMRAGSTLEPTGMVTHCPALKSLALDTVGAAAVPPLFVSPTFAPSAGVTPPHNAATNFSNTSCVIVLVVAFDARGFA